MTDNGMIGEITGRFKVREVVRDINSSPAPTGRQPKGEGAEGESTAAVDQSAPDVKNDRLPATSTAPLVAPATSPMEPLARRSVVELADDVRRRLGIPASHVLLSPTPGAPPDRGFITGDPATGLQWYWPTGAEEAEREREEAAE